MTVKSNQRDPVPPDRCHFAGKRKIPFTATDHEKRHRGDIIWELQAKVAPEQRNANWPGNIWIVDVITDTIALRSQRNVRRYLFHTSLRTHPATIPRVVRPALEH